MNVIEMVYMALGVGNISLAFMMSIRGFIVYISTMALVRINRKFLGVRTSSNFVLFIMLGSMFAAAVTSENLFLPIMITIFFLSFVNRYVASLFFYYPQLGELFVGAPVVLVSDGVVHWRNMEKHLVSKNDLLNELQTQLHITDVSKIERAYLATDGTIDFVMKA